MKKPFRYAADKMGVEVTSANFARFLAIFLCDIALILGVVSIIEKESEDHHIFYDAANAVGSSDALFMLSSRILDRMTERDLSISKKFISSVVGGATTLMLMWSSAFLCMLSATHHYKQPPILPILMATINAFPVALLNWEWSNAKKNVPRILAMTSAACSLGVSLVCLQQANPEKQQYYFQVAAMLQNGAFVFDLSNRVADICITNAKETKPINKATIVAALMTGLLSIALGIANTAKWIKLPLAMQNVLLHCLVTFYCVAQMRFTNSPVAQGMFPTPSSSLDTSINSEARGTLPRTEP